MSSGEIRERFLRFFEERGHKTVPSSSLLPSDPSVLLTTAGMQQFKLYYLGKADPLKDFGSRNVASVQKCFRTTDIESVGDESHLTFFEMLGNFSFGEYFKREAITWGWEFLIKGVKIAPARITATYFDGDGEAFEELKNHLLPERIKAAGKEDNFWGPTGEGGPCGPTVEFYVDGVEIWNLVFNQYYCARRNPQGEGGLVPIESVGGVRGVDTGMGLERLAAILQNASDVFSTDLFAGLMQIFPDNLDLRVKRILADHLRAAVFLIADGLRPSNKEAGYILRRLLRRILAYQILYDIKSEIFAPAISFIQEKYGFLYPELKEGGRIEEVIVAEATKFKKAIAQGLDSLKKLSEITAKDAFNLYQNFGLPFELIKELGDRAAAGLNHADFDKEFQKHQEISRAGVEKKFGGHGLDEETGAVIGNLTAEEKQKIIRLHTVTHLLNQALHDVLGEEIQQAGSDINPERTRFDFTFHRKLAPEEIKKIENVVNEKIKANLPVVMAQLSKEKALSKGARAFRPEKYPPVAKIYLIGSDKIEEAYSKEFCGGPHVSRTGEIGRFRIIKEEAVGGGGRRIRGVVD